jgi:hypothetical protein
VSRGVNDPRQAFFTPLKTNPVIGPQDPPTSNLNLYAANPVLSNGTWYVFHGGWRDAGQGNDRVYLSTSTDVTGLTGLTPSQLAVSNGVYTHANDPSVVVQGGEWTMALTTTSSHDWCSVLQSSSPDAWPSLSDTSHEISFTNTNVTVSDCARPALIWNSLLNRWEMYFDANVCAAGTSPCNNHQGQLAISTEANPHDFTWLASIGDKADIDVKKVSTGYIAVWRVGYQSGSSNLAGQCPVSGFLGAPGVRGP